METFRCYLLDANNKITRAEFLAVKDVSAAIADAGEAARSLTSDGICGFEIWQDMRLMHREMCQQVFCLGPESHLTVLACADRQRDA